MVKVVKQAEKAALLMLALGPERAASVIKQLSPLEIQKLGEAMASVEDLAISVVDKALGEFLTLVKNQSVLVIDKDTYLRKMMTAALGEERAKSVVDRILPEGLMGGVERLKWLDSQSIADIIGKEHPQIIAIILSVLGGEQAAGAMMFIPEDLRPDLMSRIATLKGVQPSALRELDQMIEKQLPDSGGKSTPVGGIDAAAHILNHMESRKSDMILGKIADQNAELAQEIQDKMFVFEDIIRFEARDIQTVLREISTAQLLLALEGAGDELKEKIFGNMSRRAAEMLREDLAAAPEAKSSEIVSAQKDILSTVKKLAEAGEIHLMS